MNTYSEKARMTVHALATMDSKVKNNILSAMAKGLRQHSAGIICENEKDLQLAKEAGLSSALIDRLTLSEAKIDQMACAIEDVIALPDPIGEAIESFTSPDGLEIQKTRVPLGVLLMIYESRPNVTADAAALAIKSGNAIILKGGKEAVRTNEAIANAIIASGHLAGMPEGAVQFINSSDRAITNALLTESGGIDAVIPRGGVGLKKAIADVAKVPILMTGSGLCHMYIGASAALENTIDIVLNAKTQRPGVCNAIETLLIDEDYADTYAVLKALYLAGVELHLCEDLYDSFSDKLNRLNADTKKPILKSTDEDWETEYLDLILSVKVVKNVKEACQHIQKYSSGHSEAILTYDEAEAEYFLNTVDSACVYWNASTRFTDGGCFGFGCEIGIATQKIHARGPMGLRELTSYKYKIKGNGDVRR